MARSGIRSTCLMVALGALAGCAPSTGGSSPGPEGATLVTTVTGFSGPEGVRYDPVDDVFFVSNFNGPGGAVDNNGFISRLRSDGTVEQMRWVAGGTGGVTLHAPRGMVIVGDTLWAADADAVRGFHRRTGAPVATVDFSGHQPGFLNDVTPGPDGALYVTDTGKNRVYRIDGRRIEVVLEDSTLNRPNGITFDARQRRLLIVPFGGKTTVLAWAPGESGPRAVATGEGGQYDGVEVLGAGRVLIASQADSSLQLFAGDRGRAWIRTAGKPADIGIDTRRNRVAVPFVALDRVDIWQLPGSR